MPVLLDLFLTFAKIGLFTFGGGYAMLSIIEDTCVERKKWITHEEMMDITVIAESTPGPIAINCATFTGYRKAGFWGSAAATFGMALPSFLIIWQLSMFLEQVLELTVIANAFRGIKVAVGVLILDAAVTMIRKMQKKKLPRTIMVCACAAILLISFFGWKFSSIRLMILSGAVSLGLFLVNDRKVRKGGAGK